MGSCVISKIFPEGEYVIVVFLFLEQNEPQCSSKVCFYKRVKCTIKNLSVNTILYNLGSRI